MGREDGNLPLFTTAAVSGREECKRPLIIVDTAAFGTSRAVDRRPVESQLIGGNSRWVGGGIFNSIPYK